MGKRQWGNPSMKGLSSASPKPSLCSHNRSPSTVVTQDVADFHVKWIRWGFFFNITFSYAFWILCMRLFSGLCLILSILLYPVILHVLGSAICEPGRGLPTAVWFPVSSSLLQTGLALGAWSLRGSFGLHLLSAGRSIHGVQWWRLAMLFLIFCHEYTATMLDTHRRSEHSVSESFFSIWGFLFGSSQDTTLAVSTS